MLCMRRWVWADHLVPRPEHAGDAARSSKPPPYSIPHLYCTLHRLSSLTHLLDKLRSHITRDILRHLVEGDRRWKLNISKAETTATIRLEACESRSAADVLDDIADLLDFVGSVVLPASDPPLNERDELLATLHRETFEAVLHNLIIPALPTTVSTVQTWLDLLLQAVDCEADSFPSKQGETRSPGVLKHFFDVDAGTTWARSRREKVIEDVRKLVSGGWGGWEGREVEVEKEVMVLVETEEDVPEPEAHAVPAGQEQSVQGGGSGWVFNDTTATVQTAKGAGAARTAPAADADADADDGWAFDEPSAELDSAKAAETPAGEGEGWDFDLEATPAPAPPAPVLKKPAREAKKLGKKLAKAKANEDEDRVSETDGNSDMTSSMMDIDRDAEPAPAEEGWGWDDPDESQAGEAAKSDTNTAPQKTSALSAVQPKKRIVLKEEKRTIKEVMLVSRSCDKVLEVSERVKREVKELANASWVSLTDREDVTDGEQAPSLIRRSALDRIGLSAGHFRGVQSLDAGSLRHSDPGRAVHRYANGERPCAPVEGDPGVRG